MKHYFGNFSTFWPLLLIAVPLALYALKLMNLDGLLIGGLFVLVLVILRCITTSRFAIEEKTTKNVFLYLNKHPPKDIQKLEKIQIDFVKKVYEGISDSTGWVRIQMDGYFQFKDETIEIKNIDLLTFELKSFLSSIEKYKKVKLKKGEIPGFFNGWKKLLKDERVTLVITFE